MRDAFTDVLLPVAIVAGLGALLSSRFSIDQDTITKITLYLLSPALILDVVLHTPISPAEAGRLSLGYILVLGVSLAAGWVCAAGRGDAERRALSIGVGLWNAGNMGLPIAYFAFGQAGFERATILFLVSFVGMYAVGPAVMTLGRDGISLIGTVRAVLRLPVLWVGAAGLAVRLADVGVPRGIDRGIVLMAQATLPMILLALGLQLGSGRWPRPTVAMSAATVARLVASPAAAYGIGRLIGLGGQGLAVLVLSAAMPTAVNALLITREYGGDTRTVAGTIVMTTLGSIVTLAVVITLLPHIR